MYIFCSPIRDLGGIESIKKVTVIASATAGLEIKTWALESPVYISRDYTTRAQHDVVEMCAACSR